MQQQKHVNNKPETPATEAPLVDLLAGESDSPRELFLLASPRALDEAALVRERKAHENKRGRTHPRRWLGEPRAITSAEDLWNL